MSPDSWSWLPVSFLNRDGRLYVLRTDMPGLVERLKAVLPSNRHYVLNGRRN